MSSDDQTRWDRKQTHWRGSQEPAGFLREIIENDHWQIPAGRALDIACGSGRNALYLAARKFVVTALDISPVALAEGRRRAEQRSLSILWLQWDLEQTILTDSAYDLIINFNYLQRSLFEAIKQAIRPGGHIVFESYLIEQQALGHPKNPDYLLDHNELLDRFRDFRVLCYHEGKFMEDGAPAHKAGIFAQKIT